MPGADADDLTRASVAAWERLRQGRWPEADRAFAVALALAGPASPAPPEAPAAARRALLVGRAEALAMLGRQAEAGQALREAFPRLAEPRPAGLLPDATEARACLGLGRLRLMARDPAAAAAALSCGLAALPAAEAAGGRWAELRGRLLEMRAVSLSAAGQIEEALPLHAQALEIFEDPLHAELARDLAVSLVNQGSDFWRLGRHAAARASLERGLAIFRGLVEAGSERDRAYVPLTQMNLGGVYNSCNELAAAVAVYEQAARGYDRAIDRAAGRGDLPRLRASRAQTEMNLAYALFRSGDYGAAARRYRSARRRYAALAIAQPHLRDDEARTWVNQAHLLARQGHAEAARRLYLRGWNALRELSAAGRTHLAADAANARFGVARMMALQGRRKGAAAHFSAAQAVLAELAGQGQLQHAPAWLAAVADHAEALLAGGAVAAEDADALLHALAHVPPCSQHDIEVQRLGVEAGLERLERWAAPGHGPAAWLPGCASAFLAALLDRTALLLGDSEPEALRQSGEGTARLVARLGRAARAWPQAPHLLADWFLRTRGLRAQRSALAEGREPRLVALREDLARLRRLEEEMLAEPPAAAAASEAGRHAEQAAGLARAARWRELHAQCESRRARLVEAGLLPAALRLDARSLAARMPRHGALLMLARDGAGELLAIALHRPGADGACVQTLVVRLAEGLGGLDCLQAHHLLRRALRQRAGGQAMRGSADAVAADAAADAAAAPEAEQAEPLASRVHEQIAELLLRPMLRRLAACGLHEVALVPSADLHLLPYHHVLAGELQRCGSRLSLYPSCGAWARCTVLGPRRRHAAAAPVWALVAPAAAEPAAPLQWVALEQLLAQRLWGSERSHVQSLAPGAPRARGTNALIGMGHGLAPAGNLARAGLLVGPGHVLGAHDLPGIRSCRRVLLSCCVLGRTDEIHAEAMGFLSSSFGYRARFGAGWLVEVPDAEACLFSLAFQHALRTAYEARPQRPVRWGEVFGAVRHGIQGGRWPAGFGAWLQAQLPAAVRDAGLPPGRWLNRYEYLRDFGGGLDAGPPADLQRLMPWVTALGQ